jgi:glucan phosphoethanolaminetransferase (alkaline phosphatase superfamily)
MNYKKHQSVFAVIALLGFLLLFFAPTYGAAVLLPAIGAFFGARKAESAGPSQPSLKLWGTFFVLAAIAVVIRYFAPDNFGGFEAWPDSAALLIVYSAFLGAAYLMFGYLAYLQRVGRTNS